MLPTLMGVLKRSGFGNAVDRQEPPRLLLDPPAVRLSEKRVGSFREGRIWVAGESVAVDPDGANVWAAFSHVDRSLLRKLHGHLFVRDLAVLASAHDDEAAVVFAMSAIRSWVNEYGDPSSSAGMAWHDETTAQRLLSLILLWYSATGICGKSSQDVKWLRQLCRRHADLLDGDLYSSGTNHGMFQDRAILAFCYAIGSRWRVRDRRLAERAAKRLIDYFRSSVLEDGVHAEHSPAYHQLVAAQIERFLRFFREIGRRSAVTALESLLMSMGRYAAHTIQPDGTFPLVGDTFDRDLPVSSLFAFDAAYQYAASRGKTGSQPDDLSAVFPAAGYAIARSSWTQSSAESFLHLAAAYHGSYHKHADDLSVWIYHRGDLLTEAGPHGYNYSDPYTKYAFSSAAHNSVLIDGVGVDRLAGSVGDVEITSSSDDGETFSVTARSDRLSVGRHVRKLVYDRVHRHIVVHDTVLAATTDDFEMTVVWHVAPQLVVQVRAGGAVHLLRDESRVAKLEVTVGERPVVPEIFVGDDDLRGGWRLGGGDPKPTSTLWFRTRGRGETAATTRVELV